ncbi:unnamed protein product [Chironomus riparius]|uniref:Protein Wnt n=1 Tax=Chironomus riparius TaxID=315576 RepID=A0A9N9WNL4_9DIPT|nr:unnamed protein product [Chironomus riparius]
MDMLKLLYLCIMVLYVHADAEKQSKQNRGRGSIWWGIAKAGEPNNISPVTPTHIYMDPAIHATLRRKQRRLARENPGVLAAIAKGANMAISECQHQFRNRRWNCTTRNFLQRGKNLFGKIVDRGCRETAFIYAMTSAAVTHSIARACSEGSIESCTCDWSHQNEPPQASKSESVSDVRQWEWGGCSDNIVFGYKLAREFVDTGERGRSLREKMNLHNNEAGRVHVQAEMREECKCHGMSGSCSVKTCWMRLPNFRVIGDSLKDRFDAATKIQANNNVRNNNNENQIMRNNRRGNKNANSNSARETNSVHGRGHNQRKQNRYRFSLKPFNADHKPPTTKDLVYFEQSPGFCEKNLRLGILGTHGRQCNDTSIGVDGCDILCCGRGYRTQEVTVIERCACTFHWCCEVKCKKCITKKTIHTCL